MDFETLHTLLRHLDDTLTDGEDLPSGEYELVVGDLVFLLGPDGTDPNWIILTAPNGQRCQWNNPAPTYTCWEEPRKLQFTQCGGTPIYWEGPSIYAIDLTSPYYTEKPMCF